MRTNASGASASRSTSARHLALAFTPASLPRKLMMSRLQNPAGVGSGQPPGAEA
jgi:hypothetical protein